MGNRLCWNNLCRGVYAIRWVESTSPMQPPPDFRETVGGTILGRKSQEHMDFLSMWIVQNID